MRISGRCLGIITMKLRQWSDNRDFTYTVDIEIVFTIRLNVGSYIIIKQEV